MAPPNFYTEIVRSARFLDWIARFQVSASPRKFWERIFRARDSSGEYMSASAAKHDYSFLLRKLHSLTGIVPVGAYLVDHLWSNSYSLVGEMNYNVQSRDLQTVPWRL